MNRLFRNISHIIPDKQYISLKYYYHFKKFPDLKNPKTFNEKIQWLKLNDKRDIYTTMVDKYDAKGYIEKIVGNEYIIPTFGVWDTFDEIDFIALPNQFVLKTTHDCGGVVICKDKKAFDKKKAKKFLEEHLEYNYFYEGREWPYKNVKPRILAEKYMENKSTGDLKDYKVFAFNGVAKMLFVAADRQSKEEETKFDFYDMEFNHLGIVNGHPNSTIFQDRPENLELMKDLACKLSVGFPLLRVDFYEVNGRVYIGELTLSHYSGFIPFEPAEWDLIMGDYITLPCKKH